MYTKYMSEMQAKDRIKGSFADRIGRFSPASTGCLPSPVV
jgi:hypothetical protein